MTTYLNLGGNSSVVAYENSPDYIKVEFKDGSIYLYTYESAGREKIEEAKRLAEQGQGLNTFVIKYMKDKYASKLV